MIELKLRIADGVGSRVVTDYLLDQIPEKLRNACITCEVLDRYESGAFARADFIGKTGKLRLVVEKARDGYPARNTVGDYVTGNEGARVIAMLAR